jgi:hypothetical protein
MCSFVLSECGVLIKGAPCSQYFLSNITTKLNDIRSYCSLLEHNGVPMAGQGICGHLALMFPNDYLSTEYSARAKRFTLLMRIAPSGIY